MRSLAKVTGHYTVSQTAMRSTHNFYEICAQQLQDKRSFWIDSTYFWVDLLIFGSGERRACYVSPWVTKHPFLAISAHSHGSKHVPVLLLVSHHASFLSLWTTFDVKLSLRTARQLPDLVLDYPFACVVVDGPYPRRGSREGVSTAARQPLFPRH